VVNVSITPVFCGRFVVRFAVFYTPVLAGFALIHPKVSMQYIVDHWLSFCTISCGHYICLFFHESRFWLHNFCIFKLFLCFSIAICNTSVVFHTLNLTDVTWKWPFSSGYIPNEINVCSALYQWRSDESLTLTSNLWKSNIIF